MRKFLRDRDGKLLLDARGQVILNPGLVTVKVEKAEVKADSASDGMHATHTA